MIFHKTLFAAVLLVPHVAVSGGFQLNSQSNTGLGRAFSGDAVISDNASSIARNAATMMLFDKPSMSLGIVSLTSMVELKDATYTRALYQKGLLLDTNSASANYDDAGDVAFVPNFYWIQPVNQHFAWGVAAYSNFGTKTEYAEDFVASEFGGLTDVKSFNLGLSVAYRVDDHWSVGAGLDVVAAQGKMQRRLQPQQLPLLEVDATGVGLGFNLGLVYELDSDNRFGLSYRYSPKLETKGEVDYAGYLGANGAIDDTVVIPLPDMAEFSGFHRFRSTPFAAHYSVQWIGWDVFQDLNTDISGTLGHYHWRDGWHYSVGGTYFASAYWTLRAGYMLDKSVQDALTSISVPDSDRQFFSAGVTYHLDSDSNIDFGFTYLLGADVEVVESKPMLPIDMASGTYLATQITGVTHANAMMMGLQYSQSF
ncbi:outer membrane protein transport protein [Shewanella gelidii]|uniref:Long-chain fatty acid transporter n=1 Tax=Shewanella gelidii TaxID=1642821 RepID=A0A917JLM6_9GAMM|nr:outer membrane protein transport protein [Shewanella gelidii]MCL1096965.1 outer membrane protein transport protein [Shewanella gelidii]GGI71520.1 long-chain fatty acid transporter [Shewanella gelidii]